MKYLTVPRVLAATLAVPVLVAVGDSIGIFGGYLVGVNRLGFNPTNYLVNTSQYLERWDIISGLIKGAAFGFIVAVSGCYFGMNSARGAQGVEMRAQNPVRGRTLPTARRFSTRTRLGDDGRNDRRQRPSSPT